MMSLSPYALGECGGEVCFAMLQRPPRTKRTDALLPYPALFRSHLCGRPAPTRRRAVGLTKQTQGAALAMNAQPRKESMRIAGDLVSGDGVIEVHNPWDNSLVGTVPKATVEDVRRAYDKAAAFKPKLSRHERSVLLRKTAEIIDARRDAIAR